MDVEGCFHCGDYVFLLSLFIKHCHWRLSLCISGLVPLSPGLEVSMVFLGAGWKC